MQSIKITVSFISPLASRLQSDTIFGQFCWMYRDLFGQDKLHQALASFKEKPFIVFSDGFLEGNIALPILKPQKQSFDDLEDYSNLKKIKKLSEIKLGEWVNQEVSLDTLAPYINQDSQVYYKSEIFLRNSINRITNTTGEGLYQTQETFYKKDTKIDIYAKYDSTIALDEIKSVFEQMGKFGFGKDKSTGKGRFKVVGFEENPSILETKDTNAFISLSNGIVDDDCQILYAKYFTKFSKHGGYGLANPFKNPVILMKAGSTFKAKKPKDVYGRALELSSFEGHYHSAYLLPVFVQLKE